MLSFSRQNILHERNGSHTCIPVSSLDVTGIPPNNFAVSMLLHNGSEFGVVWCQWETSHILQSSKLRDVLINCSVLPIDVMFGKQNGLVYWY